MQSLSRQGTLVRGQAGRVPFTSVSQVPGRCAYEQVFAYGDAVRYGFDGTNGWINDAKGTAPLPAAERLDLELLLDARAPLRLRELFPEMSIGGFRPRGEGEAVVVLARSPEGIENELLFDRETGLLLQAGDISFEDYRPEGPLTLPHRVLIGAARTEDDLRVMMEITTMAVNEPVDPSAFAPPACPMALRKAPLYTLREVRRVEVLESVKRGGKDCRFLVELAYPTVG